MCKNEKPYKDGESFLFPSKARKGLYSSAVHECLPDAADGPAANLKLSTAAGLMWSGRSALASLFPPGKEDIGRGRLERIQHMNGCPRPPCCEAQSQWLPAEGLGRQNDN